MVTRWTWVLVVLLLGGALSACAPSSLPVLDPPPPEVVADPTPGQVAEALRFGVLAPLPPGGRIVALERNVQRDPWIVLAIRLPAEAVEPYLIASGLGPFAEFSPIAGRTVYGTILPSSAPGPSPDFVLNDLGIAVGREAGMETTGNGHALLHVWLRAT